jgi:undecaprenyl-diphosphatase
MAGMGVQTNRVEATGVPPTVAPAFGRRTPKALASVIGGFVASIAGLLVLAEVADRIRYRELVELDVHVAPVLHQLASPPLDLVMQLASTGGSNDGLLGLTVIVVGAMLVRRRPVREVAFLATAITGSVALNETMKVIFERPRPRLPWADVLPDYSFPSGHAMNSLVLFAAISILIWVTAGRRRGCVAAAVGLGLGVLIGISRIYLGYHYPTDVVGGYAAGAMWLAIVWGSFRPERGRRLPTRTDGDGVPCPTP